MKLCKTIFHMCTVNFRNWSTDYKIWTAAVLLLLFCRTYTKDYGYFCYSIQMNMSPWVFPILIGARYLRILFFLPLILIFCNAPFIDNNQPYLIVRSRRLAWSLGQILYIILATAAYFLFLILIMISYIIPHVNWSLSWGKVLSTLANTNASQSMGLNIIVPKQLLLDFTPVQAMWFSFLLCWFAGIFLGLVIYFINSWSQNKGWGVFIGAFFVVFDSFAISIPTLCWVSPITWSALGCIDIGHTTSYPPITYIYIMYLVLIGILIVTSIRINKKQTIDFIQPV